MSPDTPKRGQVLDPSWEDALRAGQAADDAQGTVEDELAVVHLLRHAAGAEPLTTEAEDRIWADMTPHGEATAWWRKAWVWWGSTAVATAAAAAVLVVVWPTAGPTGGGDGPVALGGTAAALEQQFMILEPGARKQVADAVDTRRGALRQRLLASASGAEPDAGGAP